MSIATRTGDDGSTGLMYNRRVSKTDVRVEAYGSVDELNAALGMARSASQDWKTVAAKILVVQEQLVVLMGELATSNDDRERYVKDGFHLVTSAMTHILDDWIEEIESQKISYKGWATPGGTAPSAALDLARTASRRAERNVARLEECGGLPNHEVMIYLNRLSDVLWLMARWVETKSGNVSV